MTAGDAGRLVALAAIWGASFLFMRIAALELSAGLLAVLNATAPMWGALLSFFLLREQLSFSRLAGLVLAPSPRLPSPRRSPRRSSTDSPACTSSAGPPRCRRAACWSCPSSRSRRRRLIADIGPTGALTVTYLIPAFGILWGALFLGEAVSLPMLSGAALVVLGTLLVLRK